MNQKPLREVVEEFIEKQKKHNQEDLNKRAEDLLDRAKNQLNFFVILGTLAGLVATALGITALGQINSIEDTVKEEIESANESVIRQAITDELTKRVQAVLLLEKPRFDQLFKEEASKTISTSKQAMESEFSIRMTTILDTLSLELEEKIDSTLKAMKFTPDTIDVKETRYAILERKHNELSKAFQTTLTEINSKLQQLEEADITDGHTFNIPTVPSNGSKSFATHSYSHVECRWALIAPYPHNLALTVSWVDDENYSGKTEKIFDFSQNKTQRWNFLAISIKLVQYEGYIRCQVITR